MSKTVGIDLGTTNSVVAIVEGGEPIVITTAERDRLTPSMVAFKENGECLVGQMAKRQATLNPENTVSSIKRLMGRRFDDPETAVERTRLPYEIVPGPQGNVCAKVLQTGQTHAPQEISAMILDKLKKDAESYLGAPVTKAVITVPAYFNDSQRQATKEAGQIAGLDVLRIVNEPTAAALAYGLDKKEEETILVFDLGGGTFDVSILEVSNGLIQVIATQGDTHLGGDDWDMALVEWITSEFLRKQGINLKQDRHALQRVREAAEKAKIELSTVIETQINLPFITTGSKGSKHLQMNLTRSTLEELTQHLVQRLSEPVYRAMQDAQVGAGDLDAVVLVGGCTRMPMVQELVQGLTGQEPRHSVHAEEAVARGAALQAAILAGDKDDMVLLDVIPLSLGLETLGGMMTPLIPRNTTIPTRKSQVFSTAEDEQTTVEIRVLQGERPMSGDNTTLGVFRLEGIPPAPRGIPQIEVMFDIDANGILNVTARDKSTGHSQAITIATCTDLNEAEVEQQIQEAAQHAPEDRQRHELTEARNAARQLIHQVQRSLSTLEEQVGDQTRQQLERRIAKLKGAITGTDTNRIQRLTVTLQKTAPELSQAVYTRRSSDYTGGIQNGKANDGNEAKIVIEGEFDTA